MNYYLLIKTLDHTTLIFYSFSLLNDYIFNVNADALIEVPIETVNNPKLNDTLIRLNSKLKSIHRSGGGMLQIGDKYTNSLRRRCNSWC